ncbi:DUF6489 family protein [Alkalilimnicola sp. S0819]|uniref:DUF6489 family protein n=1 Tax=Alkalilimnicola sp. S0819 TaxID=2613922 RepID=UPI0012629F21|nr:DUF6489 family protein [Alkalilimnicola sp. S0819]KAB7622908.1 hypothetical protein F3N43_11365 [Alkalilimnicola sp. S0819]MPQ17232.1 hypothetical protein [Alkalilimnicola sp. S0819]
MKIRVDVDATPEELRSFFGLPDVGPLQDEILAKVREKMLAGAEGYDPLTLMKPFLPEGMQSFEGMQRMFWEAMRQGMEMNSRGGKT